MESGRQMALAISAGYLLGRRRKRRLTVMLGAAAMVGVSGGPAGQVLRRGAKLAGSQLASADVLGKVSPELSEIAGMLRGDLLKAGKSASRAAVSSRIDSLSDRLHDRAETLRSPAPARTGDSGQEDKREDKGSGQAAHQAATRTGRLASGGTGRQRRAPAQSGAPARSRQRPARAAGSSQATGSARAAGSRRPVRRATPPASEGR